MDKTLIKLIDNTSFYEIPMAKIELSKISAKFLTNSDPVDTHNMAIELIEMMSGQENKNYNFNNLFYYMNACFNLEFLFFNTTISDWEPILEPWNGEVTLNQVAKMTRLKINMTSDIMLNINLSHQMMVIFNSMMKKLKQSEIDWVEEGKNYSAIQGNSNKNTDAAVEFRNKTGINIIFWFDSDPEIKIELNDGNKNQFTQNELVAINQKLDAEKNMFTKDKFSFQLEGFNIIEKVDFSFVSNMMYPVQNENRYFEICVNISIQGLIKVISVESNVYIFNNTVHTVSLSILNSKAFLNNYSENNENQAFNFDNSHNEVITTDELKRVPVTWLMEPHIVFGKISLQELNFHKMFYSELNFVYKLGKEIKENINDGIGDKSYDKYSKFITYSKRDKTATIGLDVLVLKTSKEKCDYYCYSYS